MKPALAAKGPVGGVAGDNRWCKRASMELVVEAAASVRLAAMEDDLLNTELIIIEGVSLMPMGSWRKDEKIQRVRLLGF